MKSFPSLPTRTVKITRDTGQVDADKKPIILEVELTLSPWPLGYSAYIGRVFPPPLVYVNGVPQESNEPHKRSEYDSDKSLILVAKCLGEQLDTQPPKSDKKEEWAAYAKALRAEFAAAHFVEGDIATLINAANLINQGMGRLGNAEPGRS